MTNTQDEAEAATTSEDEETMEQCVARHMENDPELSEEAAKAACEQEKKKPEPPATPAEEKGLLGKMEKVIDEVTDFKFKKHFTELEKTLQKRTDEIEDRYIHALKKSLGVPDEDTAVTHAELPGLLRKILLEIKPEGKKTITKTEDKPSGDEDKSRIPKAEDRFKELMKGKGLNA